MSQKLINQLKEKLVQQFAADNDLITQTFKHNKQELTLIYLESVCDQQKLKKEIISPYFEFEEYSRYEKHLNSLPSCMELQSIEDTIQQILRGNVVVLLPNALFIIGISKVFNDKPTTPAIENTLLGPQLAFSENIETALAQIRHRYVTTDLKVEKKKIGTLSQTEIFIVYDETLVDQEVLQELQDKLTKINVDVIQAAGQLENFLNQKKRSLFPTMMVTERPDRAVTNLAQGKVLILIDGTPFALIVPAVFYDFFAAVDDLYNSFWISHFLVVIRYIGLLISLLIPALYVAATSYNPEIFRVQLAISIAGSRAAVPYPSFLEVLFMLGMMELLTEASLRLPKAIGSTATTVGGLILGQAAQQAGLVSSIMIIVVAAVAIANFVIPINSMSFAIRVTKYILIFLASLFGIIGVAGAFIALIVYLCSLRSFGKPYLKLFFNEERVAKNNPKGN